MGGEDEEAAAAAAGGDGYHVTEEERMQAADDVAACIWLAGDRLREALIVRVRDTWRDLEAEIEADAAIHRAASGVATAAAAAAHAHHHHQYQHQQTAQRKSFRQRLAVRLETTRKVVEAELRAADEAAAANGDDSVFCDPMRWNGTSALRADVRAKLESFQDDNMADPTSGEYARFSTINCREDLLERQRSTRDAVVASVMISPTDPAYPAAASGGGSASARHVGGDLWTRRPTLGAAAGAASTVSAEAALRGVGGGGGGGSGSGSGSGLPEGLVEQLEANHLAAEEERMAGSLGESSVDLKYGLMQKLEATRVAAAVEILKAGGVGGGKALRGAESARGGRARFL